MKKIELFSALILLALTSKVSSHNDIKTKTSCEKLQLAPVNIKFDNQSESQLRIYNVDTHDGKEDASDNLMHYTNEILIDTDSFHSFSSASKKDNCTCLNPCILHCCQNKQNLLNIKRKYNYLSQEEYNVNDYKSYERPVCVKNFINNGYFAPSSFHPSEPKHNDLFRTKYLGDIVIFNAHHEVMFSTVLKEFCEKKLLESDDYYLINNKTLIKKSKTDSLLEIIATADYCVEPLSHNFTSFTICENNYGLNFDQELTQSSTTRKPFNEQTPRDVTDKSFREPKSNVYETSTRKNSVSTVSTTTQVNAAMLSNYSKFSWVTSMYLIILLTVYYTSGQFN